MRVVIFILFIVILSFNVNALAVVSDYLENDTLFLVDGTSKLYGIRLQNPSSEEILIKLTYDNTTAKVIDYEEIYTVPPQTNKPIFFNVSSPLKSRPDDTFTVSYTVHQLSGPGSFLLKINKNFNVKIIKDPEKFYIKYAYVAYAAIAFTFLLYILFIYRKKIINYLTKNKKVKFQKKIFKNRKIIKYKH